MFLYKSDVASMLLVQPERMSQVLLRSGALAAQSIKEASYGVVMQVDGIILGLLPVVSTGCYTHVLGSHSVYLSSEQAHQNVLREMLEMMLSELPGPTASARVNLCDVRVFEQCGFVVVTSSENEAQMTFCMPTTERARVNV
jgi:hypothetical protein